MQLNLLSIALFAWHCHSFKLETLMFSTRPTSKAEVLYSNKKMTAQRFKPHSRSAVGVNTSWQNSEVNDIHAAHYIE